MVKAKSKKSSRDLEGKRIRVRIVEAIVRDSKGRVLVLKRSKMNKVYVGKWQLPGGKADGMESALRAIKREIKEETNCSCSHIRVVKKLTFSEWFRGVNTIVELTIFECKIRGKICLSSEHTDFRFVKSNGFLKRVLAPISKKALFQ